MEVSNSTQSNLNINKIAQKSPTAPLPKKQKKNLIEQFHYWEV